MNGTGWIALGIALFFLLAAALGFWVLHDGGRNWPLVIRRREMKCWACGKLFMEEEKNWDRTHHICSPKCAMVELGEALDGLKDDIRRS